MTPNSEGGEAVVGAPGRPSHTPGPWLLGAQRDRAPGIPDSITIGDPTGPRTVALVTNAVDCVEIFNGGRGHKQLANARLIAAAPDLLQALKELVGMTAFYGMDSSETAAAEAAIRKAEGGGV